MSTNELETLEHALSDIDEQIERLQTSQPVSDEGKDASRDALKAARVRVAILRAQAARGEAKASVLAEAISELEALESSLACDEDNERTYNALCALREELKAQYDAAYARHGKAVYASLKAELSKLVEKRESEEYEVEKARQDVLDYRAAIPRKLASWPELAADASERYAGDFRPISHVENVLASYLAFLDACDNARGRVPAVVGGVNIIGWFNLTPEAANQLLVHGSGRMFDDRERLKMAAIVETLRNQRQ
jgi:chromosome segregation ATPase